MFQGQLDHGRMNRTDGILAQLATTIKGKQQYNTQQVSCRVLLIKITKKKKNFFDLFFSFFPPTRSMDLSQSVLSLSRLASRRKIDRDGRER